MLFFCEQHISKTYVAHGSLFRENTLYFRINRDKRINYFIAFVLQDSTIFDTSIYSIPHFQLSLNLLKETDNNPMKCQSEIKIKIYFQSNSFIFLLFKHLRNSDFWIQEHSNLTVVLLNNISILQLKTKTISLEVDENVVSFVLSSSLLKSQLFFSVGG